MKKKCLIRLSVCEREQLIPPHRGLGPLDRKSTVWRRQRMQQSTIITISGSSGIQSKKLSETDAPAAARGAGTGFFKEYPPES